MRLKESLFGVFIGNAIAGAIMLSLSLQHISEGSIEMMIAFVLLILVVMIAYMYKKKRNKKYQKIKFQNIRKT